MAEGIAPPGFSESESGLLVPNRLAAVRYGPAAQTSASDSWLVRAVGGGKTKAGIAVSEYTALHLPVVYACVNRIANPIARFPMRILRVTPGGGTEEVLDHPLSRRLGLRPNDFMSSRTLRKTVQGHALLWGNGYIEIQRSESGQAIGLWPLLPWATSPIRDEEQLFYRTTIDGEQYRLDYSDVLHVMDMSQDGYVGLSPIAMARQALGMSFAMEEYGAKFFANDAKSGGFLMHPGKLSPVAQANLSGRSGERTDAGAALERQGGLDNAHRVKVLEEGMKFISTTIPPEDSQFLGSREFQTAEIARMYDVPLILLQSHEKSTSWGTGIEQLMIGFVRQTIEPWVNAWEQELNFKLFTEEEQALGYHVKFNMNALLRGDMAARAAFYKALFEVGALTINQICALEDANGIGADGEERFVSNNVQSLKNALNPPAPPPAASRGRPAGPTDDDEEGEPA